MTHDPFRIRDHVAAFDALVAEMTERSAAARRTLPMIGDVRYGAGAAETLDLFFPPGERRGLPVHVFIHGGYWRLFSKDDYSHVAATVTAAGAICVVIDYALMPAVRMAAIVDQVRRAGAWLRGSIAGFGGDPGAITASGHSAGAHLATFLFDEDGGSGIGAALLLGGLYDLGPLQHSFLAPLIGLTDEEVARFSPLTRRHDPSTRVALLVGQHETAPFHGQAADFARHLRGQGLAVTSSAVSGRNHMDSVRDLGIPGSEAAGALRHLITGAAG